MADKDLVLEHLVETWLQYSDPALQRKLRMHYALECQPEGHYQMVLYYRGRAIVRHQSPVEQRKNRIVGSLRGAMHFEIDSQRVPASIETEGLYELIEETYQDITSALDSIDYDELEMHVESLLGIVRTVLEPNPTLHEKLYDVLGKAEEGYARYIVRAEKREKELRSKDNETADYLIECIGRAEDAKEEIRDLLRKVNVH